MELDWLSLKTLEYIYKYDGGNGNTFPRSSDFLIYFSPHIFSLSAIGWNLKFPSEVPLEQKWQVVKSFISYVISVQ